MDGKATDFYNIPAIPQHGRLATGTVSPFTTPGTGGYSGGVAWQGGLPTINTVTAPEEEPKAASKSRRARKATALDR
jgi:hypothetical protein